VKAMAKLFAVGAATTGALVLSAGVGQAQLVITGNDEKVRFNPPPAPGRRGLCPATQSWFGQKAVKSRSTKSGAGLASLSRRVVTIVPRRRLAPINPAARISRAMRLRPCLSPPARSSACTRGAPWVWATA